MENADRRHRESPNFRRKFGASALIALLASAVAAGAEQPARVVSMNLCTDQLAMMLAAPGQLVSVSSLASDPLASSMVAEASAYPQNRGGAEQIFLLKPDLVLAGTYGATASVDLLRRLGVKVVELPPIDSLAGVSAGIETVGRALGREAEARAMAARFEADLAALAWAGPPATAALYYPNGYTTGAGTLADDVLAHVGFRNIGAEAGVTGGGILPLERLVMAAPQVIVTSAPYPGDSRSEEILRHPALADLRAAAGVTVLSDADWLCGTPHLLRAVAKMRAAREAVE